MNISNFKNLNFIPSFFLSEYNKLLLIILKNNGLLLIPKFAKSYYLSYIDLSENLIQHLALPNMGLKYYNVCFINYIVYKFKK